MGNVFRKLFRRKSKNKVADVSKTKRNRVAPTESEESETGEESETSKDSETCEEFSSAKSDSQAETKTTVENAGKQVVQIYAIKARKIRKPVKRVETTPSEASESSEATACVTGSTTGVTESGTRTTESGTGITESGTGITESGTGITESGTGITESGTGIAETGTEVSESGTEVSESGTEIEENDGKFVLPPTSRKYLRRMKNRLVYSENNIFSRSNTDSDSNSNVIAESKSLKKDMLGSENNNLSFTKPEIIVALFGTKAKPGAAPKISPSMAPSAAPKISPSVAPSAAPNISPSVAPTAAPSIAPSVAPSAATNDDDDNESGSGSSYESYESEMPGNEAEKGVKPSKSKSKNAMTNVAPSKSALSKAGLAKTSAASGSKNDRKKSSASDPVTVTATIRQLSQVSQKSGGKKNSFESDGRSGYSQAMSQSSGMFEPSSATIAPSAKPGSQKQKSILKQSSESDVKKLDDLNAKSTRSVSPTPGAKKPGKTPTKIPIAKGRKGGKKPTGTASVSNLKSTKAAKPSPSKAGLASPSVQPSKAGTLAQPSKMGTKSGIEMSNMDVKSQPSGMVYKAQPSKNDIEAKPIPGMGIVESESTWMDSESKISMTTVEPGAQMSVMSTSTISTKPGGEMSVMSTGGKSGLTRDTTQSTFSTVSKASKAKSKRKRNSNASESTKKTSVSGKSGRSASMVSGGSKKTKSGSGNSSMKKRSTESSRSELSSLRLLKPIISRSYFLTDAKTFAAIEFEQKNIRMQAALWHEWESTHSSGNDSGGGCPTRCPCNNRRRFPLKPRNPCSHSDADDEMSACGNECRRPRRPSACCRPKCSKNSC